MNVLTLIRPAILFFTTAIPVAMLMGGCSGSAGEKSAGDAAPDTAEESTISVVPAEKIAEVEIVELQEGIFNHEILSNGRLVARDYADLYFRNPEMIADIYVRNGQRVNKGQKIAQLDLFKLNNQLVQNNTRLQQAELAMKDVLIGQGYDPDYPEKVPDEVMKLARLKSGLTEAETTYAATQKEIEQATLTAPFDGVVANLEQKPNNMAASGKPLCRIINDRGIDIAFTVLESELSVIHPGDAIEVAPYSGGKRHSGRITEVNPTVDDNGMVKVWASVDGAADLIDGMNARVHAHRAIPGKLVVPKGAVVLRSGRQVVFTLSPDGKAMWNYVHTGLENMEHYTIEEGLAPGMTVIVSGNVNLAHEAPVKVVQ